MRLSLIPGLAAATGVVFILVDPPTPRHGFVGYVIALAAAHAIGMSAPIRVTYGWKRAGLSAAYVAVLVVGAVSLGVRIADASWPAAIGFILVAAVAVVVVSHLCGATRSVHNAEAPWFFRAVAYLGLAVGAIAGPVYAGWLILHASEPGAVDVVWGLVAGLGVVNSALWLVTGRFPDLIRAEEMVDEDGGGARLDRFAPMLWTQLVAFLASALMALMALLVALAAPRHFDQPSYGHPPHALVVTATLLLSVALAVSGYLCARRAADWPAAALRTEFTELRSDWLSSGLLFAALTAMIVGPALCNSGHGAFREESMVFAAFLAIYIVESVFSNGVWLQLTSPDWNSALLIILLPLAIYSSLSWLLQSGLWAHGEPTRTDAAVPVVLVTFVAVTAVASLVGSSIAWRAPRLARTLHRPGQNIVQDVVIASALGVILGPLFMFIASRVEDGAPGVIGALIAVLAGVVAAFGRAIGHDFQHIRREAAREATYLARGDQLVLDAAAVEMPNLSAALEGERVRRVKWRIERWQVPAPLLLVAASVAWLAVRLL